MATPAVFAANMAWLGVGKEGSTTYGTPAAAPTFWIPILSPAWSANIKVITDGALRGSMAKVYGAANGPRSDKLTYQTYPFLDSLFPHMLALLGGADTVTGSADPYTHVTSLLNTGNGQPPSYTLWLFNGSECWQMPGSLCAKVEVDLPAQELGKVSVEWMGLPATNVTAPTNTPSTASPWPGVNAVTTIGGVTATTYSDTKLTYSRATEAIFTATGSYAPYMIFGGEVDVAIDLTGVYAGYSSSELQKLLTNTHPSFVVKCNAVGDSTHYAQWQHTSMTALSAEPKINGGKYVTIDSKWSGIANATDATAGGVSPVNFSIKSPQSTTW